MEYIITFIEGLASFISPCVLPVIPIYVSYFGVQKVPKKTIINSIGFVLGFSLVFILLGVFAGTFGHLIHEYSTYINIILGIFLVIIGLNYIGILTINFLNKTKEINYMQKDLTLLSACFFGMFFALSWTPCVGAFLASALITASTTGSVLKGATLLFLYSLGLAIPFVITTIFLEKIKKTFNLIKKNYNIINKLAASILIFSGLWYIISNVLKIGG